MVQLKSVDATQLGQAVTNVGVSRVQKMEHEAKQAYEEKQSELAFNRKKELINLQAAQKQALQEAKWKHEEEQKEMDNKASDINNLFKETKAITDAGQKAREQVEGMKAKESADNLKQLQGVNKPLARVVEDNDTEIERLEAERRKAGLGGN